MTSEDLAELADVGQNKAEVAIGEFHVPGRDPVNQKSRTLLTRSWGYLRVANRGRE